MLPVPSPANRRHPFVRRCRELASGREDTDDVLLDGAHLVEEALAAGLPFVGVVADDRAAELAARVGAQGALLLRASPALVAAASPVKTSSGIVAVARWRPSAVEALLGAPSPLLVGLVGLQDPGNVGGIIRSADALGATGVLALDGTAHPGGWRALRGAMGSTFRVPVGRGAASAVIASARARGITVVAAVADGGRPLDRAHLRRPLLLLVGNEGAGLPDSVISVADTQISIPMRTRVNSLNVGVTAALLLWEARDRPPPEGAS